MFWPRINESKAEGMCLGRKNRAKPLGVTRPANSILALGIYFSFNDETI